MKQGLKKALVMLLTVAMVFTYMAMPVYADDFTVPETDEVIADAAETEALAAEEAEEIAEPEAEVQEEVLTEEEEPAPEAIQEEVTEEAVEPEVQEEVLIEEEPAPEVVQEEAAEAVAETAEAEEEPVAEATELADGTYKATGLSTAVLSMYHFDADAARVVIKGDNAWLITSIDGAAEATTLKRFDGMAYGPQSKILDETDETHRTLIEGTPTANVIETTNDEGTVVGRTFVLPVPKTIFETGADIYYMLKYVAGYSATHDGDWYKASGGDYYLTGYTLEYLSDSTVLPGDEEPAAEPIELEITNKTGMFKAVTASAVENADGSAELTFALSSTGYKWLYKGTYEEALAANEVIASGIASGTASGNLIKGYENADGKWEFQMNISSDEMGKTVPVVSISESKYNNYVAGSAPLEKAYYPRQFEVNLDEATLVTGDYDMNYDFVLNTDLVDFMAQSPVSVHIVGGPNSNNYMVELTLVMNDAAYDKVTYPTVENGKVSTAVADLTDGKFSISMANAPSVAAFQDKTPLTFTFHVAEDAPYEEAGTDVERTVTFDQIARTITVEGTALTPNEDTPSYKAGQYIVGVQSIKTADGTSYGMFIPNYDGAANKALITVAEDGSATINYYNTRNTYPKIFLAELETEYLGKVATEEQLADPRCITAETYAGNSSYREFTYAFDVNDLGKTVPYVTLNKSNTFNKSQTALVFDESMVPMAVYDVINMIDALPAAEDITVLDKDAIEAARAAYDALSAKQKAQVTNLEKLVAAEEAYAALPEKSEDTIAVETAMGTLIQQYTDVNDETAAKVAETRTAYDALSIQQKAYIDDANLFKLYRAEACVAFATGDIAEGAVYDLGIDTSDNSPFIAATISPRSGAAYVYLYSVAELYNNANKISGTVSKSSHVVVGNGAVLKGLWQVQTDEGHGREFVIQLTGPKGNSEEYTVKFPSVYGTMAEGTYEVTAIQTPSSKMRKFERSTITSDGTAMTVEFVMPNTSYGKIYLGTAEAAAAATEGFIEPTGTEATSGTTGEGNVYKIPLESMYQPITISYNLTSKNTWTEETVEFVLDEQAQAVIDAIASLNLNTYFNVTLDQREQVDAANELYQALNESQKAIVENSNYSTLKKIVAMFVIADKTAAQIEALPAADAITADDVAKVREVKDAFDNMGKDPELVEALNGNSLQNSQIEKLISQELRDKLKAAVAKADEFDKAVAEPVAAMIEALPDAEAVTVDDIEAIRAAAKAYDGLTDAQKSFVENADKLTACLAALADYTAVDAALKTVPEDLSIYTEETAAAVTAAVNAVDRTKMAADQAEVDAMAQAIETAVKALKVDKFEYSGTTVQFIKKDGSAFGMWAAMEGSTFTYSEGKIHISIIPSNSKKTYSWMHWGGINEELTKDVTLTEDGKIVLDVDTDLCGWAVPVAPIKTRDDTATTSSQYYLAIPALESFTTAADYTKVDTAIAAVPEDLSIYTEETAAAVTAAVNAVDRTKMAVEQAAVDAMAQAIEDAIAGLVEKSEQEMTATVAASKGIVSVGKTTTITVNNAVGEVTYKPLKDGIVTVDKNGKVTAKKVGTVQIEVTASGDGNFKEATKTVKVYVVPGATTSVTASNLATGMKINWKKVTGATGYKVYRNGSLIATIKSGTTVTYTDKAANTNGTKYTFKVVATASTGTSTLSKSLTTYRVSRPAISSAKNSSAKTMKVTWGKNSKATGYEIMYSTSKSFASGNKTVKVTKASTVSRGIGGLTKGKTYYVKMRTYKTVSGKTYYSAWSVVKTVKITK